MPERKGPPAVSALAESPGSLAVETRTDQSVAILTVGGVLDASNSAALRDSIRKAALDAAVGRHRRYRPPFKCPRNRRCPPSSARTCSSAPRQPHRSCWSAATAAPAMRSPAAEVTRFMPVYPTEKGGDEGARQADPSHRPPRRRPAAREPDQPSRVTPAGARVAYRVVAARIHPGRPGGCQRVRGERRWNTPAASR